MTIKIKAVLASVLVVAIVASLVAGAIFTATGRAIVFAIQDPGTVNHAAQLKAEYVNQFALSGPKAQ